QRGGAVAFAHGGGERGEVERGALAVAAGEVDVAGGEGGGGWSDRTPTRAFGATSPACGETGVACGERGGVGGGEDAGEDVACFHRGQLVGVAEQDQAGAIGDGFDQLGHQRQVDHRGFVHHHHVEGQRVVGVVAEGG